MSERVGIGELKIARAPRQLRACGLGSCLAVALYDPELRLGGLAHCLLPQRPDGHADDNPAKYVDTALRQMVAELVEAGAVPQRLQARCVGGANMFENTYLTLMQSIGVRNARSARETLQALGIRLAAEEVGGNRGRTVTFDLASGRLLVYCARDDRTQVLE
jgi:chemotaxis protein CheD